MSEDTWFNRLHVKDYINAVMLEEKVIERRVPEEDVIAEKPTPVVPADARLFGVKFRVSVEEAPHAIDLIISYPKIFLDELDVKRREDHLRIIAFIYANSIKHVWNLISSLLELKSIGKVDILKTHRKTGIVMPNPWLFPPRIDSETLALIPQSVLCRGDIDPSWPVELGRLVKSEIGEESLDPEVIGRIIYTFGLGIVDGVKYNGKDAVLIVKCRSGRSVGSYCRWLSEFASVLYGGGIKYVDDRDGKCRLVFEAP